MKTITDTLTEVWAKDISLDILSKGEVINTAVINQNIEFILMTAYGQRLFNRGFGSEFTWNVFENINSSDGEALIDSIVVAIQRWEPRILLIEDSIELIIEPDLNKITLTIPYVIIKNRVAGVFKKAIIN